MIRCNTTIQNELNSKNRIIGGGKASWWRINAKMEKCSYVGPNIRLEKQ
jgi:hypothetical protein